MSTQRTTWLLVLALSLTGCQPLEPILTESPTATVPSLPILAPATETPAVPAPSLNPKGSIDITQPIHDAILFSTHQHYPLNVLEEGNPPEFRRLQLWVVTVDGQSAGFIADPRSTGNDVAWHFSTTLPQQLTLISNNPIALEAEFVQRLSLPSECANLDLACGNYSFSSNGEWLAFFWGEELCGRPISVLNVASSQTLPVVEGGGHGFSFLADGRLLVAAGHCEGGKMKVFDPNINSSIALGGEGSGNWNVGKDSLAVQTSPYVGWGAAIWGYNFESDFLFLATDSGNSEATHPIWANATTLLFEHRPRISTEQQEYMFEARQIWSVDSSSGSITPLLTDPNYDYHLCAAWNSDCEWRGDWVQIRRFPFRYQATVYPFEADYYDPAVTCVVYGIDCPDSVELLAINWRTGELVPWEQAPTATPDAESTATPPSGPDLSRASVYAHPSGNYAFYIGNDGRSLWMVPASGEPQLWVTEGENFIYLP